jgi:hypothetical protein
MNPHVRHDPGQHQVPRPRPEPFRQIGPHERVREVLHDHRLVAARGDAVDDRPDLVADVVGRAGTCVVLDVDDGDAGGAGAVEQLRGVVERRLDALQLHRAAGVGVLAVDHDQRGLREPGRLGRQPGQRP